MKTKTTKQTINQFINEFDCINEIGTVNVQLYSKECELTYYQFN